MTPDEFDARTSMFPCLQYGMWPSELYLFASACVDAGVTAVVESGVYNGVSTQVLHALFPGQVVSVEYDKSHLPKDFPFPVQIGDGAVLAPRAIARMVMLGVTAIGVLLDGPKSLRARAIKDQCVHDYPAVRVVGIHDHKPGLGFGETSHSWNPAFREAVGRHLDARVPLASREAHPKGPGLALWIR